MEARRHKGSDAGKRRNPTPPLSDARAARALSGPIRAGSRLVAWSRGVASSLVLVAIVLSASDVASARGASGAACQQARRARRQARVNLSVALRKSNLAAASYRACMTRQRNKRRRCEAKHKAFRKAMQHSNDMRAAYRFARDKAARTCRQG